MAKTMMKLSKTQCIVLAVVVVVLAVGGWLWYARANSTANWTPYTNTTGKYSLKYPKGWASTNCEGTTEVILAANKGTLGTCTDPGQIVAISAGGDQRSSFNLDKSYSDVVKRSVTVDNVSGQKVTGVVKDAAAASLPVGTKVTEYFFFANDKTYVVAYAQRSNAPNVQRDFDKMVTKTLKFNK